MPAHASEGGGRRWVWIAGAVAVVALVGAGLALTGGDGDDAATDDTATTAPPTTDPTTTAPTTAPPVLRWPLTGLAGADEGGLARPALAVKIDNVGEARPQVGITQADVVYEERVEGGATRFLAVFHSTDAEPIGPVRSGRSTDVPIFSALNRPMFAWSGSNDFMAAEIRAANMVDVGHTPAVDQYYRDGGRPAPHNLFINGYLPMVDSHRADAGAAPVLFAFRGDGVPAQGEPVSHVELHFGGSSSGQRSYDWNGVGWARSQDGTPHVDAAGSGVQPENVIVQFIEYHEYIHGGGLPVGESVGEGEVWVLTAGVRIVGRWVKPNPEAVTQYLLPDGTPIGLTPGHTWVALVPPGGAEVS